MEELEARVAALELHEAAGPAPESIPETREPKRKKCSLGKHTDRLMRGGKRLECTVCGDCFPCATACEHFDCQWERDEPGAAICGELGHELYKP